MAGLSSEDSSCRACFDPDSRLHRVQLTYRLTTLTWYLVLIAITTSVSGVLISAAWDLPARPAIVLLATTFFFVSVFLSSKKHRQALAGR